ncbi:MAG: hypothetical protein RH862_00255 [Leptospiraceae bacterium]
MNPAVKHKTESDVIEQLWELYSDQNFEEMVSDAESMDIDCLELVNLARLELGKPLQNLPETGLFNDLLSAMKHYHERYYEKAAMDFSRWLLHKGYYSELALDRFTFACSHSKRYDLIYTVCSKLMKTGHRQSTILGGFLLGAHESGRHDQVIKGFESFGKEIKKTSVLHRVALSYIHLNRNQDAENMLLRLYESISGKPYSQNLNEYRKRYNEKLPELKKMEKSGKMDTSLRMDLGMAHLFNGDYSKAIQIFQSLISSASPATA